MRQPVPRGDKKRTARPVTVTTENKFIPKISDRTIKKKQEAKERKLKGFKYAGGVDKCGVVCLYTFLVIAVLIGIGGVVVCAIYLNDNVSSSGWKIAGIVFGIITSIIGIILILLTIFKQARNRPWRYKKQEQPYNHYGDLDDDDDYQTNVENYDGSQIHYQGSTDEKRNVFHSTIIHSSIDGGIRETATSPIYQPTPTPLDSKNVPNDTIFCPGCNRTHPSSHQCMYSTRTANSFATQFRLPSKPTQQDSIAIQTEDDGKKKKKIEAHTAIDRSLKYSNTIQTQTDVSANPRSNITESIILRRVPIPTAKVVVQQPTTKVMIVKVPNVAGQLVIQPKSPSTD